ncbi:MAG TPA: NrdH-redoxin [Propionibacteriaceae bacterium]|nr:glutaredoxin family protein [Micropruina sp.]HBX81654.1 NrdH-redoxin [Propionibacteriaceae bacterium]HBY24248.1 NrdH-redoxin [Propionibacteriaceae bacterium]
MALSNSRVVVLTRAGCHLCVDAVEIVSGVCHEAGVSVAFVDVDSDPALKAEFSDHVPVTFVDGQRHAIWHVDATALRAALAAPFS